MVSALGTLRVSGTSVTSNQAQGGEGFGGGVQAIVSVAHLV